MKELKLAATAPVSPLLLLKLQGQTLLNLPIIFQAMTSIHLCHMVAVPYPGRGHINSMMNLCKLLVSKNDTICISFIVTEEWLHLMGSDPKPDKIRLATVPNVIPSELVRSADLTGFMEAVSTKMGAPFEQLLDQLEPPPSLIMADTFLLWAFGAGNQRNIPVAAFWPMSATAFLVFYYFDMFFENGHFPLNYLESGHECVGYIPGVSSMPLGDLPPHITGTREEIVNRVIAMFSWLPKAQYFLLPTIYELEPQAIDALKQNFSLPIYTIGPAIPFLKLGENSCEGANDNDDINYLQWLDRQPCSSVLYVSLGSFLTVSSAQMDEIVGGLCKCSVKFLWVARGETKRLREVCGDVGLVVPWCDQLRVLCHSAIGGFWSHCGWNSVREGIFAGVPFLTFPIVVDQFPNRKLIVEDLKVGWRVKDELREGNLVTSEEIAGLVQKFMDLESNEGKEMRRRVKELQEMCQHSVSKEGSSESNINSFITDISLQSCHHCYS